MLEKNHEASLGSKKLNEACYQAALAATVEALSIMGPRTNSPRILFDAARWGTLNGLLENIETVIPLTHKRTRLFLKNNPQTYNPFESQKTSLDYYKTYFNPLSSHSMNFVAPWLIHLFPSKDAGKHEDLFEFLREFILPRALNVAEFGFMTENFSEDEKLMEQALLLSNL